MLMLVLCSILRLCFDICGFGFFIVVIIFVMCVLISVFVYGGVWLKWLYGLSVM